MTGIYWVAFVTRLNIRPTCSYVRPSVRRYVRQSDLPLVCDSILGFEENCRWYSEQFCFVLEQFGIENVAHFSKIKKYELKTIVYKYECENWYRPLKASDKGGQHKEWLSTRLFVHPSCKVYFNLFSNCDLMEDIKNSTKSELLSMIKQTNRAQVSVKIISVYGTTSLFFNSITQLLKT